MLRVSFGLDLPRYGSSSRSILLAPATKVVFAKRPVWHNSSISNSGVQARKGGWGALGLSSLIKIPACKALKLCNLLVST